jgi:hypothetical protein
MNRRLFETTRPDRSSPWRAPMSTQIPWFEDESSRPSSTAPPGFHPGSGLPTG